MRVLALLAVFLCAAVAQDSTPEQLFRDAVVAQQRGDYDGAVAKYRDLVRLRPDVPEVHANLGAALVHLGRFDEAISEYENALAGSDHPAIRLNLALAYYKVGRIRDASAQFETLHAAAPSELRISLLLADCWLQQGENKKVIDLLSPYDAQSQDDPAFSYVFGMALMRDNQMDRGQQVIDRILRNGDSAQARILMATARMRRLDYMGARQDLMRAIELDPKLPGLYSLYGRCLSTLLDTGAIAAFQKELETNPNDFDANLNVGVDELHNRQFDAAEAHFRRALAVRPDDPGVLMQMANLNIAQDKRDAALSILEDLVKRFPDFREAHVLLARIYYRMNRKADGDAESAVVKKLNEKKAETATVSPDYGSAAH